MKLLINESNKILRHGEFVTASADDGEFIINTDTDEITKALATDICKANSIGFKSKDKASVLTTKIEDFVEESDIGEVSSPTKSQRRAALVEEHKDALVAMMEGDGDQNSCLVFLVNEGVPFNQAGGILKAALEGSGLLVSNSDRKAKVATILAENDFDPESWSDVEDAVELVLEDVPSADKKSALSAIRAFCKVNEIAMPKKVREKKERKLSWAAAMRLFVAQNPACSDEDLGDKLEELGKDDSKIKPYIKLRAFANLVIESQTEGEESDEDDEDSESD